MPRTTKVEPINDKSVADANAEYKGDPGLQDGRRCQDVCVLILFILFWVGMGVIAAFAIMYGDLNRLQYGTDSFGNLCGVEGSQLDARNLPYLYFMEPGVKDTYKRCVESCPTQDLSDGISSTTVVCRYNITFASTVPEQEQQLTNEDCYPAIKSTDGLNRCAPDLASYMYLVENNHMKAPINGTLATALKDDLNDRQLAAQLMGSVQQSWKIILLCSGVALAISFVWLVLLQFVGGLTVWLTVIVANVSMLGITALLWYNWYYVNFGTAFQFGNAKIDEALAKYSDSSREKLTATTENTELILVLAIVISVFTAILFFVSLFSRKRIQLAIKIINEATRAIRAMPMIVFFPIFKYISLALLFAWFIYIMALLATSGSEIVDSVSNAQVTNNATATAQAHIKRFEPSTILNVLQIYYLFGLFWTMNLIIAIGQCTIAGAVATWYWTRDKGALPRLLVLRSLGRTLRYHLGSLAFGALTIAIVQIIRFFLIQAQSRLRGANNVVARYILSCMQCCFACLEKILKFINRNAYIEIAVYGYSFCTAARKAFDLLVRNAFRVVIIDGVAGFLLFLGQLLVTALSCALGLYLLQTQTTVGDYYGIPLLLIAILAWVVASAFISVVRMAINTIFLCFCEDSERNDGSPERPYYMSDALRAFTDKYQAPKV